MHKLNNGSLPWYRSPALVRLTPIISAILLTILSTAILIAALGHKPLEAYSAIFDGAFGDKNAFAEVLVKTVPLLLAGLGTAFAFRCQMWNIGAEGQLLIGALSAAAISLMFPNTPAGLSILFAVLGAIIAGGIWAGIAGFLKVKLGASEIINTIMMNYIATYLINYLVRGPLKEVGSYVPQSSVFSKQFWLPLIMPPTRLHLGIFLAILTAGIVYVILWKTSLGFNIIAVGSNPRASRVSGISVAASMVLAMFVSGGLAGLAGASEVLGLHHRILDGVSAGYGFSAMAIAILGGLHPIGVSAFAFIFAALRVGADHMQRQLGVPSSLVYLVEGLLIVFIQGRSLLPRLLRSLQHRKASATQQQEA